MARASKPWKKAFNKIPSHIQETVKQLGNQPIRIAGSRTVPLDQIRSGYFEPIGVLLNGNDSLMLPEEPVIPPETSGPWARRNINGWEKLQKDLPKEPRSFTFEVPNFGDHSKGTHDITQIRQCYQRLFIPPLQASIGVYCLDDSEDETVKLAFDLDRSILPTDENFDLALLMGLNILQESTGCTGVISSELSTQEVLKERLIDWEIFPSGSRDERKFFEKTIKRLPEDKAALVKDRREFLERLHPECLLWGASLGDTAYFGAKFSDELVVFENIRYGNAIYVLGENWETLSKLSRTELLQSTNDYTRICHSKNWKARLRAEIDARRQ